MMICLPEINKPFEDIENNLTVQQFVEVRKKLSPTQVSLSLPIYRMESFIDLNPHLEFMGLQHIFEGVDFSGMEEKSDVGVSEVKLKALVEITEEGAEAAGVSGMFMVPMRVTSSKRFRVNHLFLFTIIDTRSKALLFMGGVMTV
ncbi:putative serpin-like protein [Nephila pilipes]|uniref:Putative serpin-like protein n=1 Tax=Nephila pilipes TaxID=299642 RepID=A0A8X6U3W8_NEPPI|nr:putative serpin-like protein [Nephila pilipes]